MSQAAPPPVDYAGGSVKPHRGTMILVFGILGFVVCFIFGIVAWVMGNNDLREMRAGTMDRSGESITNAGRIVGMIAAILQMVVIGIAVLSMCAFAAAGAAAVSAMPTTMPVLAP